MSTPSFEKKISPSKLAEIEQCPCYWQDPNRPQGEAASDGDRMHRAFETNDLTLLDDPDQREAVRQCLEYKKNIAPNPMPADGSAYGPVSNYDVVLHEVWLESDIGKRGRADLVVRPASDRNHVHLLDTKFGAVPVAHAKDNIQGIDYAYRSFLKWPEVHSVTVHFLTPKQQDATVHTFTREADFERLRQRIISIHEAYNDPFRQPRPTLEKACQYCDLKARCPALGQGVVAVARRFDLLPLPENFNPESPRTPTERGLAQDLADLLMRWGEAVKRYNAESVRLGAEAEGYGLRSKRGITTVKDPAEFATAVSEKYDVPLAALFKAAGSLSLPDTVAFLKAQFPETDAKKIRRNLESSFGSYLKSSGDIVYLAKERKGKKKEAKDAVAKGSKLLAEMQAAQADQPEQTPD